MPQKKSYILRLANFNKWLGSIYVQHTKIKYLKKKKVVLGPDGFFHGWILQWFKNDEEFSNYSRKLKIRELNQWDKHSSYTKA